MRFVWYVYALVFIILIGVAIYSFFGGFSHEFMDPAM